jgi:hypothetical protein
MKTNLTQDSQLILSDLNGAFAIIKSSKTEDIKPKLIKAIKNYEDVDMVTIDTDHIVLESTKSFLAHEPEIEFIGKVIDNKNVFEVNYFIKLVPSY